MDYKELYESLLNSLGVDYVEDVEKAKASVEAKFRPVEPVEDKVDIPDEVRNELKEYRNKVVALETANFVKTVEGKVGEELAQVLGKIRTSVDEEVLGELVNKVEGLKKLVNDLGASKGEESVDGEPDVRSTDDVVNEKALKLKEELGLTSFADAIVELAKREPELVANWR